VKLRGAILFLTGALGALAAGWLAFPRAIYRTAAQPVDFSHKIHADQAQAKCADCHGDTPALPTLDKCAGCHAAPMGNTAAEKQFIEKYVTPNREPAWLVYARQPENVYFSHAPHLKAKVKCERCHRNQGLYYEDRISGYSRDVMSMDTCIACHREKHQENSCLTCHK
jgi:c(7)-type cytochrome triheme protein